MLGFLLRIIGNSAALYVAVWLITGFTLNGGIKEYALAGVVLGLLNMTVKPVLKFISTPIIILTLGLFTLVINALLLWLVDYIFDFIIISDIVTLVWATIVVGVVNLIVSGITKIID